MNKHIPVWIVFFFKYMFKYINIKISDKTYNSIYRNKGQDVEEEGYPHYVKRIY